MLRSLFSYLNLILSGFSSPRFRLSLTQSLHHYTLAQIFRQVPNALSPSNKSISSKLTCVASLKKKNMTGKVTQMLKATNKK